MIMIHTVLNKDFDLLVDAAQWCGERVRIGQRVWRIIFRNKWIIFGIER